MPKKPQIPKIKYIPVKEAGNTSVDEVFDFLFGKFEEELKKENKESDNSS